MHAQQGLNAPRRRPLAPIAQCGNGNKVDVPMTSPVRVNIGGQPTQVRLAGSSCSCAHSYICCRPLP